VFTARYGLDLCV